MGIYSILIHLDLPIWAFLCVPRSTHMLSEVSNVTCNLRPVAPGEIESWGIHHVLLLICGGPIHVDIKGMCYARTKLIETTKSFRCCFSNLLNNAPSSPALGSWPW